MIFIYAFFSCVQLFTSKHENPEAREDFEMYFDDDEGENVEIASSNLKGEEFVRYRCSQARIVEAPVEMMRKYKKQLKKQRKRDERMGWTPEKLRKVTAEVEQEARRLLLSINLEKLNLNLSPEKEQEQQGGPSFFSSRGCSKE